MNLEELIQILERIKLSCSQEETPRVEIFDYRYEQFTDIDSIEYDNHTNTIKIK